MAKKITELTATTNTASGDLLAVVDVSDTAQSANGSTRKITRSNLIGTATPTELSQLASVTAGIASASKAAVLGTNKELDEFHTAALYLGAGAGTLITANAGEINVLDDMTANTTELNYLDTAIPGTVVASKAVVVDADKDIGDFGTITIDDDEDLAWASGAKIERSSGHLVLTPETSKLVKVAALRQDNTSDAYENNTIILTGWGAVNGGGGTSANEGVTFGVTFTQAPIVNLTFIGTNGSAPSAITDFAAGFGSDATAAIAGTRSITTGGFSCYMRASNGATLTNGTYYGYTWIAVGELD